MTNDQAWSRKRVCTKTCVNREIVEHLIKWRDDNNFDERLRSCVTRAISQIRKEEKPILSKSDAVRVKFVGDFIACQIEQALMSGNGDIHAANPSVEVQNYPRQAASVSDKGHSVSQVGDTTPSMQSWSKQSSATLEDLSRSHREAEHADRSVAESDRNACRTAETRVTRDTCHQNCTQNYTADGKDVRNALECFPREENGPSEDENCSLLANWMPNMDEHRKPGSNESSGRSPTAPAPDGRYKSSAKEYEPRYRSGPYALLLALYNTFQKNISSLGKQELIAAADAFTDEPLLFSGTSKFGKSTGFRYDGWSSMGGTLIKKGLVRKCSNPARYSLTVPGLDLARRLFLQHEYSSTRLIAVDRDSQNATEEEAGRDGGQPFLENTSFSKSRLRTTQFDLVTYGCTSSRQLGTVRDEHRKRHNGRRPSRKTELLSDVCEILVDEGYSRSSVLLLTEELLGGELIDNMDVTALIHVLRKKLDGLAERGQNSVMDMPIKSNTNQSTSQFASVGQTSGREDKSQGPVEGTDWGTVCGSADDIPGTTLQADLWIQCMSEIVCEIVHKGVVFENVIDAMEHIIRREGVLPLSRMVSSLQQHLTESTTAPHDLESALQRQCDVGEELSAENISRESVVCPDLFYCQEQTRKGRTGESHEEGQSTRMNELFCAERRTCMDVISLDEENEFNCPDIGTDARAIDSLRTNCASTRGRYVDGSGEFSDSKGDVVLLVDNRELYGSGQARLHYARKLESAQRRAGRKMESRCLPVGDAIFVWRDSTNADEVVLDMVVERKTVDDFAESWRDGRIVQQVAAMDRSGFRRKMLLLEGRLDDLRSSAEVQQVCVDQLRRYLDELSVCHGYYVHNTVDMGESVEALFSIHAQFMERNGQNRASPGDSIGKHFREWVEQVHIDRYSLNLEQLFTLQLCAVPGIGRTTAQNIVDRGLSTPALLLDACRESGDREISEGASDISRRTTGLSACDIRRTERELLRKLFTAERYELDGDS